MADLIYDSLTQSYKLDVIKNAELDKIGEPKDEINVIVGVDEATCLAASYLTYSAPFVSDGYVQVRMEATI